jgi:nucleoside-diphosphate-sugar epimerase
VVVGATGNAGTSVLDALARDDDVESVLGLARRLPSLEVPKVEWRRADIVSSDLVPLFRGADAVVHLAWKIQPSRDLAQLRTINVEGSRRVFRAIGEAGVPALVHASSVGAYSPGPKDRRVDESWPVDGISTSFYSRHKSEVEHMLDGFERERPGIRVVRLRPALIFKRGAASEIRRLFAGPLLPSPLARIELLRVVPDIPGLRVQAVHSLDVGEAYRLAVTGDARGPFNIAAEPPLDARLLAGLARGHAVRVPRGLARGAVALSWRLRLQPSPPGWFDLGVGVPLLDTTRARDELGWQAKRSATDALIELLDGMREHAGIDTPPLASDAGGPGRAREFATGVGARED